MHHSVVIRGAQHSQITSPHQGLCEGHKIVIKARHLGRISPHYATIASVTHACPGLTEGGLLKAGLLLSLLGTRPMLPDPLGISTIVVLTQDSLAWTCCPSAIHQVLPCTPQLSLQGIRGPCRQLERDHSALSIAIQALLLPEASAHGA